MGHFLSIEFSLLDSLRIIWCTTVIQFHYFTASLQAIRQSGDQQRAVKELVSFSEERADFITKTLVNEVSTLIQVFEKQKLLCLEWLQKLCDNLRIEPPR